MVLVSPHTCSVLVFHISALISCSIFLIVRISRACFTVLIPPAVYILIIALVCIPVHRGITYFDMLIVSIAYACAICCDVLSPPLVDRPSAYIFFH